MWQDDDNGFRFAALSDAARSLSPPNFPHPAIHATVNSCICSFRVTALRMSERIDVYISSTSRDLVAYREAVRDVVLRLGMQPVIMEAFNPTDRNALQKCYDEVQRAEVFAGIYALSLYGRKWLSPRFMLLANPRSGSQPRKTRLRCLGARNIIQPIDDA